MNPLSIPEFMPYFLLAQKIFFVLCAVLYFVFALVVVKQVTSMSKNVKDKFNPLLVSFSYVHLLFSVFLIILTWFVL